MAPHHAGTGAPTSAESERARCAPETALRVAEHVMLVGPLAPSQALQVGTNRAYAIVSATSTINPLGATAHERGGPRYRPGPFTPKSERDR